MCSVILVILHNDEKKREKGRREKTKRKGDGKRKIERKKREKREKDIDGHSLSICINLHSILNSQFHDDP